MTPAQSFNEDQRVRWNGQDGEYWTLHQERLDRTLSPFTRPLLEFAGVAPGSTVIDIGCGCGFTTVELARAVGPTGKVVGLDISEPMLALAERRLSGLANATCFLGDAAGLPLGHLKADLLVSRFGVMFFGDPVAAFTNLRTALAPSGRLRFVCWRSIGENPWLHVPLQAVYQHVPPLPKPLPDEPGPFAFADTDRVTRILTAAGFSAPTFTRLDVVLDLAAGGTLEDAVLQSAEMGPAKRALSGQPDHVRDSAMTSIRDALRAYAAGDAVTLPGAVWLVAADVS